MSVNEGGTRLRAGELVAHRYVVGTLLGRGAMGEVYAAVDQVSARTVALKVLTAGAERYASVTARMLRGARAVYPIDHPHLVKVLECSPDGAAVPFVAMEYPRGETLAQVVRVHRRLEPELAVELARQLSSAIASLHAARVLHRDVKPGNVVVVPAHDGEPAALKLLDFGLARLFDRDRSITRADELLGTLVYLAPERLAGGSTRSPEADVYAVGCVLFEMLTGRLPFAEPNRRALRLAVQADRAPDVRQLRPDLSATLAEWIARALDRNPERRPTAAELERALGTLAPGPGVTRLLAPVPLESVAGKRFRFERRLGGGAHGEVFVAFDLHQQRRVAIKRLNAASTASVQRIKREFRTVASLDHPNLVRFEELWAEGDDALIAMELVEGRPLLDHLRAAPQDLPAIVAQLCSGLRALHEAGLVHRDLKPAHVLVTAERSAKLIDFSVTARTGGRGEVAGTPAYMAPEVPAADIDPAADIYALGVVLREVSAGAAAGQLPAAFDRLLEPVPERRPSAAELCEALEDCQARARAGDDARRPFVGRSDELTALRRAATASAAGPRIVLVSGSSGIGKSALLRQLEQGLPSTTLVLRATCRPVEFVPFSAIDAAIDALSEHLSKAPALVLDAPAMAGVPALLLLFPALRQVPTLRAIAHAGHVPPDASARQSRAYETLRELLRLVARTAPTVLLLDDLHWLDQRTASLLAYLLGGDDAPAVTLIGMRRPNDEAPSSALQHLRDALSDRATELTLGPLTAAESGELLALLETPFDRERIARHAGGHPMLLHLLSQSSAAASAQHTTEVGTALLARVGNLPESSRRLLCAICCCEVPLPLRVVVAAMAIEPHAFQELARQWLAISRVVGDDAVVEPYHSAVREAVLATLSEAERCDIHRAIAAALSEGVHAKALIEHVARSGAHGAAAVLAARLARRAEQDAAFEEAAALYTVALAYTAELSARVELFKRKADALHGGGSSFEAARCLIAAASEVGAPLARELEQRAGELSLLSGDRQEGLQLLRDSMNEHGLVLARNIDEVVQQTGAAYASLKQRGLLSQRTSTTGAADMGRLDLCLALAQGLSHVDLRGLPFSFRALHFALDAGDPARLQRACATFVWSTSSHFPTDLIEPVLALCEDLTAELGTAKAQALLHVARAERLHFAADFLAAELECERAEHLLLERCTGVARELAGVRGGAVFIQYGQKGDFHRQLKQTLRWQADAERRGDRYHFNMLRVAHSLVWIAKDDPARARAELIAAEQSWPPGGITVFETTVVVMLDVLDRYEGKALAHLSTAQGRASVLESPAGRIPLLQTYLLLHRSWGCLRAMAEGTCEHDEPNQLSQALTVLRQLEVPIAHHVADAMQANSRLLAGDVHAALELLNRSELGFRGIHMDCLAASVRARRGEVMGGELGERIELEGLAQLSDLGVERPKQWCRAYFSMFDRSVMETSTIVEGPA